MEKVFLRTAFNYDRNKASDESGLECLDVSRTKQAFKEECDINTIVRRFRVTGELPTGVRMPTFGDFAGVSDFHSAMNAVAAANESFDAMPAAVRKRFDHDPAKFVAFCSDKANLEEARKMGLAVPELVVKAEALAAPGEAPAPSKGVLKGDKGGSSVPPHSSTT